MSPLEQLVDDTLRDPFAAAGAHARDAGRVIGYVGGEIPVELIIAGGAFPFRLPARAGTDVAAADQYLESSFAPDIRSIAQQYLDGRFDFLESVILPRTNDSAQRLYYYLCELRTTGTVRGPELLIFDLAKIPRDTSRLHSRAATRSLGAAIGAEPARLPAAIAQRNRRRDLFARLAARRGEGSAPRGSLVERVAAAAERCHAERFDAALEAWLAGAPPAPPGPRVVLAGSAPPDERLHLMVEAAGGNVVAEWGDHAACAVAQPSIAPGGSWDAIADHYHELKSGTRAFVDSARLLGALAGSVRADGVIIWLIEEEDALIWNLPAQKCALAAAGVPVLALSRRRWDAADAQAEINAFTRSLEVRP